ncbi:MAG: radical SAM protein [Deltaproteobacteria bacterium]|nr:radical SAM protein [Candidatus Deferrimicrobiaceae bacterium]
MAFPFDPAARFHVPEFIVREKEETFVAIDPARANWVCLNRAGIDLLRSLPGKTLPETVREASARLALPVEETEKPLRKFLAELARKEFLSTGAIPCEHVERSRLLRLEKLHEVWIVTNYECNQACRHCYTYERVANDRRRVRKESLLAMIDECRALGAEVFYLTGGEPFLRGDLLELIAGATARSKAILFTNGTLITADHAARLAAHRERLVVQISLEGPDEETNALLRAKGSFALAMRGIGHLLRAGVRVGVSSTPTPQTASRVPELTRLLAGIREGGRGVDYHHIIYVLDAGNAREGRTARLSCADLIDVVTGCKEALRRARADGVRTGIRITNDKIFEAIASNGPRKDMCGAGYTILGINADGMLHPCATTMHDDAFNLGGLLDERGNYLPGEIGRLWREGVAVQRIRSFTVLPGGGKVEDLRYFHGGGCWYHMRNPRGDISKEHPFYPAYEALTEKAILHVATKGVPPGDPSKASPLPRIYSSMARTRISCAGVRKTKDLSASGMDNGYCICFA